MEGLFFEGFILQASLIFALGAQNIFVLESGMKRQHPLAISFVCFLCDLSLILLGVAGAGTLFAAFSQLKILIGLIGVVFLFHYGLSKVRAKEEASIIGESLNLKLTLKRCILLAMTFSLLNPHAYLDAFILIGGYSSKYPLLTDRIFVGFGAAIFSLVWFLLLSSASSLMKPIFDNPLRLRIVMNCSGMILLFLSFRLGMDVYNWIINEPQSSILVKNIIYPGSLGGVYTTIMY